MCKDRDERIEELVEKFRWKLQESFPGKGSRLDEIEQATEEIGKAIETEIEDAAIGQEGEGHIGNSALCACGGRIRYVRSYVRELVTLHGLRRIPRAYYHCKRCRTSWVPLDAALGLDSGSTTLAVRSKIARIAALAPFERCSRELFELCGVDVSAKTVERVAEGVGERIGAELSREEAATIASERPEPSVSPERLYVTLDGAIVSVDGGWRECKVGAVYETKPDAAGLPLATHIEHVGTFGNCEAIGDKVFALAFRRGVMRSAQTVVLGDGAPWIWNQARDNFPGATEIVDFFHAAEHLALVASAWYGAGSPKAGRWLSERKGDLIEGRFDKILSSLRAWRPKEPDAHKVKRTNLGYFLRNRERMQYKAYLGQGLHIGSGVAESSCKNVVQARLKQSGMHWSMGGAESILQLRLRWLDDPAVNFAAYAAMPT